MDVSEGDAIWLAIVFRGLTPMNLDLEFCDEGCTFDVRLRAGTAEAELADLVNAAGWSQHVAASWRTRTAWTRLVIRVVEQRSLRRSRQDLRKIARAALGPTPLTLQPTGGSRPPPGGAARSHRIADALSHLPDAAP
jgi:hypothetical protein